MTVFRDIEIVQGQRWVYLFEAADLVSDGNGLRLHIRDHLGATLLRAALTHDGATNARVSFATGGVLANLGATISTAWDLQNYKQRRWVYSLERYSLTDAEDVDVLYAGDCLVNATATDESSITTVTPWPSYDLVAIRFDLVQSLSSEQKARARANIGIVDGSSGIWGTISGTLTDQTDLVAALAAKADTGHSHSTYLPKLAIGATDAVIVTVSTDGEVLSRSSYTAATLITAAAAAAPVQSVAGRTGAVVIAVADVTGAEASANKAQPSGYASLDSGGKIPQAQLPAIAISEYLGDVASQAAMLALSGQKGDWCTRSDAPGTWIISGTDPTLLGSWTAIVHPTDAVTSVAGRTGAVTLSTSDVSGLTALATTTPGTGVATFLATPSSANLAAAVTDETGSGALVFATSPTLVTPALGTPSSGTLTNCTGYPAASSSASGIVELAIAAEVSTGTDTSRAMTVDSYKKSTPFYSDRAADWTLALTDVNVDQWFNNGATALVCTIPLNATVAFAVGDTIPFLRLASGTATIDAATSVTLNGISGGSCTIQTQYQGALLKKVGTDSWIVSGDVSAVV
jgi:hypothetical protein